jgi:hypothetical protein
MHNAHFKKRHQRIKKAGRLAGRKCDNAAQASIFGDRGRWIKETARDSGGRAVAMFSTAATPTNEIE